MKIGILGAGHIGGTVGRLLHRAGHEVLFGTRHPDRVTALVEELGPGAESGTPVQAAEWGEAILLAVPLYAMPELAGEIRDLVAHKPVLDAMNAYESRDGDLAREATAHPGGSSGWVAQLLPDARIVKAFNTVNYRTLEAEAHRGEERVGVPVASDDPSALAIAEQLVRDAGFAPVRAGDLAAGKRFEPGAPVYNTGLRAHELEVELRQL